MQLSLNVFVALAVACVRTASASSTDFDKRLDAAYLELGRGDIAQAKQHSAELLAAMGASDARRARVLQLQLDLCFANHEAEKPSCEHVQNDIAAYVEKVPSAAGLARRFEITKKLDANQAAQALAMAKESLATAPAAELPEWHLLTARTAVQTPGQMPFAADEAKTALALWHPRAGAQARCNEAELHYFLASAAEVTGSRVEALAQLKTGLDITIKAFGDDSAGRFRFDSEIGAMYAEMGRFREAIAVREEMMIVARKRFGEDSIEAAKSEAQLGAGLQEIGDYVPSRAHYEHALATVAKLPPNSSPLDRGLISANFGNVLQEMGDEDAALEQYRLALVAWGELESTTHARAVVSSNIGNTEFRLEHFDAAIDDFQRAIALREKSDGKDSPGLAYPLEGMGSALLALNRPAEAEKYYRRAIELRGKAIAPNHPTLGPLNFGLALARWGQGDEAGAFEIAVKTAEHQQELLATFAADFTDRQSAGYRGLLMPATALAVTLAAHSGDSANVETAWRLVMIERGLVARTEAHRLASARSLSDPEMAKSFAAWRAANVALGEAWLSKDVDASHMAALKADSERAESQLWSHASPQEKESASNTTSITDMARALPDDGVLVAFTEGVVNNPAKQLRAGDKQTPEDWYAFALRRDGKPQLSRVGNVDALSAQSRAWYLQLRDPATDLAQLHRNGDDLRKNLLDPFLKNGSTRHVFLVPEGELYRLSFAALPDASHGYLIENGTSVHTLSHESDIVARSAVEAKQTLLAGAPLFAESKMDTALASRQLCVRAAQEGFAAIPNAGRELDTLNTLLSATPTSHVTVVRGAGATKQNVVDALTQADVVHLATHGFSLDESCDSTSNSRGVTLDATKTPNSDNDQAAAISGLAFTGANISSGQTPIGVLSAGELATLDLSKVSWIALSACDSGLGPIGRNEGVFGMRRALRLAGARTVVMSLWQVDDEATADLMESLYRERFVQHDDVPDAMAAAMRNVLASRRAAGKSDHPYYWAAFVSEGDWH